MKRSPNGWRPGAPRSRDRLLRNGAWTIKVVWTFKALQNIDSIRSYIEQFSVLAAQQMAARLKASGESLVEFPSRGASISNGRRQLSTTPPYLIRYRVEANRVVILEIRHAAEDAP